ncbi:MAG: hypothetical protein GY851_18475 [bacterium]|nr:hypothetical protein [bacterium]
MNRDPIVLELPDEIYHKQPWTLTLRENALHLSREDGTGLDVTREQADSELVLLTPSFAPPLLTLKAPSKLGFKLTTDQFRVISGWIGWERHVRAALKRRMSWSLPVGILWIVSALPMGGDPAEGIEAIPLDPVGMLLGVGLLGIGTLARILPHRGLFLVDSVWYLLLLGHILYRLSHGWSWFSAAIVVLLIPPIVSGVKAYAQFRPVTEGDES